MTRRIQEKQNAWKKGSLRYTGLLEAYTIEQVETKKRKIEKVCQENEKTTRKQYILQKSPQREKTPRMFPL